MQNAMPGKFAGMGEVVTSVPEELIRTTAIGKLDPVQLPAAVSNIHMGWW